MISECSLLNYSRLKIKANQHFQISGFQSIWYIYIYFFFLPLFDFAFLTSFGISNCWILSLGKTATEKVQEQLTPQWRNHAKCSPLALKSFKMFDTKLFGNIFVNCVYLINFNVFLLWTVNWDQTEPHL